MEIPETLAFVYRALQHDIDTIKVISDTTSVIAARTNSGDIEIKVFEKYADAR